MPTSYPPVENDVLASWAELNALEVPWDGILVGNGASIAVWPHFAYASLFETARSDVVAHPLSPQDLALFDLLSTANFEYALGSLKTASTVATALEMPSDRFRLAYESIQRALFEAVHEVHVPWSLLPEATLTAIGAGLRNYRFVSSTNYDLLIYWAIMAHAQPGEFVDYFWHSDGRFDATDVDVWDHSKSRVLYLHGGLHLQAVRTGGAIKRHGEDGQNLLDGWSTAFESEHVPLLVSEGVSADKLRTILTSDYLAFAFGQFARHAGALVVFGNSLSPHDNHLVGAMQRWSTPQRTAVIAFSILPSTDIIATKAYFRERLPYADLFFFDATSHPLGDEALRIGG